MSRRRWPAFRRPWIRGALFACVLGLGLVLRTARLDSPPCWVDEAESCINALTILEHGVPVDRYLGQPIFENLLIEPWPESAEYEFRDLSYSRRGLAIYHGWLPLYSIALSLRILGVRPDTVPEPLRVVHGEREVRLRTVAGRVPGVVFGMLALLVLFATGRLLGGRELAWSVLIATAFAPPFVSYARQARYYSATVLLSTAACAAAWLVLRRGEKRDHLFLALVLALLFHTHVLTFTVACSVVAAMAPVLVRRPGGWLRLAAVGALVALATLPWIVLTGFLDRAQAQPSAWRLLDLPRDLWLYPEVKLPFFAIALAGLIGFALLPRLRALPGERAAPWREARTAGWLLAGWLAAAWILFTFLTPVASFFVQRLTIPIAGPGMLLGCLVLCTLARSLAPRRSLALAVVLTSALTLVFGQARYGWLFHRRPLFPLERALAELRAQGELAPGTRVYATPNDHLPLTYYTGMPVQSVAPVRREFLERWSGPLIVIEAACRYEGIPARVVREAAASRGIELDEAEAGDWSAELSTRLAREDLQRAGIEVEPPLGPLPAFTEGLFEDQRARTARLIRERRNPEKDNPAVFRGQRVEDWSQWWPTFFYRLVDAPGRSGEHLNYARRVRGARAKVLPSGWTFYYCPPLDGG
ncbi:MAG TPA: glycosyltransferase family 39 protein [Planctomycetota bacterium]|nr:glycosyltransferase family 39 protein [Planctomycetota bacterium]